MCMQTNTDVKKPRKKKIPLIHPHQAVETESDRKGGTPGKVEYHNNTWLILLHYSTHLNCEPFGVATP